MSQDNSYADITLSHLVLTIIMEIISVNCILLAAPISQIYRTRPFFLRPHTFLSFPCFIIYCIINISCRISWPKFSYVQLILISIFSSLFMLRKISLLLNNFLKRQFSFISVLLTALCSMSFKRIENIQRKISSDRILWFTTKFLYMPSQIYATNHCIQSVTFYGQR